MPVAPHAAVIPGKFYHTGKVDPRLTIFRRKQPDGGGSIHRGDQFDELQRRGDTSDEGKQGY